jgi:hypothetical protein
VPVLAADLVATALGVWAMLGAAGHLGPVHGVERVLVALVALGPFLVLAVVAVVVRRRDARSREGSTPGGETGP